MKDELATLGDLGHDVASTGIGGITNALADAVFESQRLEDSLRNVAKAGLRQTFEWSTNRMLVSMGAAITGGWGGGSGGNPNDPGPGLGAKVGHGGGVPGWDHLATRSVDPSIFNAAPRAHTGIGPGERPVIIRDDEGVFTPGQMRAMGSGRSSPRSEALLEQVVALLTQRQKIDLAIQDRRQSTREYLESTAGRRQVARHMVESQR